MLVLTAVALKVLVLGAVSLSSSVFLPLLFIGVLLGLPAPLFFVTSTVVKFFFFFLSVFGSFGCVFTCSDFFLSEKILLDFFGRTSVFSLKPRSLFLVAFKGVFAKWVSFNGNGLIFLKVFPSSPFFDFSSFSFGSSDFSLSFSSFFSVSFCRISL